MSNRNPLTPQVCEDFLPYLGGFRLNTEWLSGVAILIQLDAIPSVVPV